MRNIFPDFSMKPLLRSRVEAAINSLEMKLEFRLAQREATDAPWVSQVRYALKNAREVLGKGDSQSWNYIQLAEEYLVFSMDEAELKTKASALRSEVAKVGGYRGEAILKILGEEGDAAGHTQLYEALSIRNDHYSTRYHQIHLRKAALLSLSWLLVVIMALGIGWIAILHHYYPTDLASGILPPFWQEAVSGLFMGALGACFSLAYTITSSPIQVKIPDQVMGAMITIIRVAIGSTAAFVALLILRAGMLENFLSPTLFKSHLGFLVIAFIAGFSERWIVNVVQAISRD